MKIISRGAGEQIVIDDHITVTIQQIDDGKVVLSIASSQNKTAYREEIITLKNDEQAPSFQNMTQ
ncbi:MAG: carbon storage regulator [Planctomycetaceae bacterium]|nr:carbon storage regulator [Planctomycetaceae bacterium]